MVRHLKNIATVNVVIAILVALGYVDYAHAHKLPIDEQCLGFDHHKGSPWMGVIITEALIIACMVLTMLFPNSIIGARWFSGIFGGIGLISVIFTRANIFDQLDLILGLYVWSAHLAFAVIGANVEYNDDGLS